MSKYSKFYVAAIPALLAGLKVLSDALGDAVVSSQEVVAVLVAGLGAWGVYAVKNEPDDADPEAGYAPIELLVGVICFVILVVVLLKVVERV